MFPGKLTNNGFYQTQCPPVRKTYHPRVILHSGIPSIHRTVNLKVAHYMTHKFMPIRFFTVGTENEVIIKNVASTQIGLLNVLLPNRASQHKHLDTVKTHFSTRKHIHNSTHSPFPRPQWLLSLFKTLLQHFPHYKAIKQLFPKYKITLSSTASKI